MVEIDNGRISLSEDKKDEKSKASKFEILEEDEVLSLEIEESTPKLPDSVHVDENSFSQSHYNIKDSYQEFQKILDGAKPQDDSLALDQLSEQYKDLKLSSGDEKILNQEANADLSENFEAQAEDQESAQLDEKTISTKNINEEPTSIIEEKNELDAFQELLTAGETNNSNPVQNDENGFEGHSLVEESKSEAKFQREESVVDPMVKKRKDRCKLYDHNEISIKSKASTNMEFVHPEQNDLYEQMLESVEDEKENSSSEHTRTMNKEQYFGYDKYAFEFKGSLLSYLSQYWKSFFLGCLSFGLFFKWHFRQSREYLVTHTYFRTYPFQLKKEQRSFSLLSLLYSLFVLLIPLSFSQNIYIGLVHIFLASYSVGFLVLEKYHNLFNNLKYQDIDFALNLTHKEYLKLANAFSLKVVFSFGILSPRAVRDLQEYLYTKLRYGRIYFRMSHKHHILSDTPIFHLILPGILGVISVLTANYLQIDWQLYFEEYVLQKQWIYPILFLSGLYLYAAIKNEILNHLFFNLSIRNSKFQYKGSFIKHFFLILSNLALITMSFGLLIPLAKWRSYKYYIKNIRVLINKPGGLNEIIDNAA